MFEIDKESFGKFLAEQRKAKGYTQKELAEKLFVSDKAVSKWERSLSMPDISLLIPLADILDVSVTELLEGRKIDHSSGMDIIQVEGLVKKALSLSEESPEKRKERIKRHAVIFGGCTLFAMLEIFIGIWCLPRIEIDSSFTIFLVLELLSLIFGIYFWFFMKERLPAYYDENRINAVSDGLFRMNMPGIYFNNSNWPHIVRYLRLWTLVTLITVPPLCLLAAAVFAVFAWEYSIQYIVLILYLAGLFIPLYIIGKKYDSIHTADTKKSFKKLWLVIFLSITAAVAFTSISGGATFYSGIRIGFVSHEGAGEWRASYQLLDGTMSRKLYPGSQKTNYLIEVDTKKGVLSIEITDSSGEDIFSETFSESVLPCTCFVTLTGTARVNISADQHSGSFSISPP